MKFKTYLHKKNINDLLQQTEEWYASIKEISNTLDENILAKVKTLNTILTYTKKLDIHETFKKVTAFLKRSVDSERITNIVKDRDSLLDELDKIISSFGLIKSKLNTNFVDVIIDKSIKLRNNIQQHIEKELAKYTSTF